MFCPIMEDGELYPDPEHDINELSRTYKINDFVPADFELNLPKMAMIQIFSDGKK